MESMVAKTGKIDLSYIYEISDGDRDFIREMLETFLKITPDAFKEIEVAQKANDWKEVGRIAHKIKPTIMLLDDDNLSKKIKVLESEAKQEINVDELPKKVMEAHELCAQTVIEIERLIETDSY